MSLKGKYADAHWAVKVLQWLGCIFVLSVPAMGCLMCFEQPLSVSSLKWIQLIQTAALFLFPPLCMAYLWSRNPLRWLQLIPSVPTSLTKGTQGEGATEQKVKRYRQILGAALLMLLALPAINLLSYLNQQMALPEQMQALEQWMKQQEQNAAQMTEQFLHVSTFAGLVVNLLLMAVLPAVAEELSFRGVLQRLFDVKGDKTKVPHMAIWCSAVLFSAIHLQFYGFFPRMLMGALFGYMLVWTGNLWTPIVMHFTNNAMAVLLYFTALRAGWDMDMVDAIGTGDTLWLGIVSMVITAIGIYIFRRSITISKASSRISKGS